jgi:hypothetical protein
MSVHITRTSRTMRTLRIFSSATSGAAALLATTGLLIALLAPGRVLASGHANLEHAAKPTAPSAAGVTKQVESVEPPDEGTTLLPASGDTQLPATPDTPRPHYGRPPVHLP